MIFGEEAGDLADFARMLGMDLKGEPLKPNPNQKAIDELGRILKRHGGK